MKIKKTGLTVIMLTAALMAAGCSSETPAQKAEESTAQAAVASADETAGRIDIVKESVTPVYAESIRNGVYSVKVDSSSGMFQIRECKLTVKDGEMSAVMNMGGTGYLKLYMGTGEEAVKAGEDDYIPYSEIQEGTHTFEVPVEALDKGIDCSAFSKKKEKWYDRVLVFRSDSLPASAFEEGIIITAESLNLEDGSYTAEVTLGGGSGRAGIESPALLRAEDGKVFATIVWGSPNYDYMKVNEDIFEQINTDGNSVFEIPVVGFDWNMPVIADTIAMSEPHEIEYTLNFDSATLKKAAKGQAENFP